MNTRKLVLLFTALAGLTATAFAQTQTTQATVAKVTGKATVTMPDGSTADLTAGMKVPQGATITTGANGDVYIESHSGYVTAIKKDSTVLVEEVSVTTNSGGTVTEEKTTMDLKSGNLVAMLDPKKKAVNNYQVRTPKGVAAARGTEFAVNVAGFDSTVVVVGGNVQLTIPGVGVLTVAAGRVTTSGGINMTIAEYAATGHASVMIELIASIAVAAENNIGGVTSADLRAVTDAVITADPTLAAGIAAAVEQYAPSQTSVITESVRVNAPTQTQAVEQAVEAVEQGQTTAPQVIDPSTVSRSS